MEEHPITWSLIIANTLIFILVFSMPETMRDSVFLSYSFSIETLHEFWRLFTSLFLHADAAHLFFNMLGLYFFGKCLEETIEPGWYLAIYFMSGFLGEVAFMMTSPLPVIGASGCIFGVMGAAMLLNPVKRIHFYIFPLPLGMVALLFVFMETFVIYFQRDFGNIAHYAHIGGLITGSLFAFFYDFKTSMKGIFVLIACIFLLIFLGSIIGLITGTGTIILSILNLIIGAVLYTVAGMLSFLWS